MSTPRKSPFNFALGKMRVERPRVIAEGEKNLKYGPARTATRNSGKHISVCVCSYKRPRLLKRLLVELERQNTAGLFTYSVVVADNDELESARAVVAEFAVASVAVTYCVEPRRGIALARNMAISQATGDYLALIDDDEFPSEDWLLILVRTLELYQVDGVLGPVRCHFDDEPPRWLVKSQLYRRFVHPTGAIVRWMDARTGNVLLKRNVLQGVSQPFKPEFRALEDQDFFRRMIEKGHRFVWSSEAVVDESVPPVRWKMRYMLRKALLFGAAEPLQPDFGATKIAKSIFAVAAYMVLLPLALISGYPRFVSLLVKLFHHLGKLLATLGIDPVHEQYVTEE